MNQPGRLTLIARMGAKNVQKNLKPLVEAIKKNGLVVVNHIPDSDKSNQVVASNNLENNL